MNMKSKLSIILLMIGLICMTSFYSVQAQNNLPDTQAVKMLGDFYTSYMTEFDNLSSGHKHRTDAILKKYCTASLINKIPKLADKLDSDPFLNAQDSDSSWVKSLVINKDLKTPGVYIVSYHDGNNTNSIIHLLVIKQMESYKIADVW
jgi:hypothetical protein